MVRQRVEQMPQIENLHATVADRPILNNVSLHLPTLTKIFDGVEAF